MYSTVWNIRLCSLSLHEEWKVRKGNDWADVIFLFKVDPMASRSQSHTAVREEVIMWSEDSDKIIKRGDSSTTKKARTHYFITYVY